MSVQYMSFSAHADAKGIMQLISYCEPKNVMLVHGEGHKMEFLKHKIRSEYGIECFMPANGQTAVVKTPVSVPVAISRTLLDEEAERYDRRPPDTSRKRKLDGILVTRDDGTLRIIDPKEAAEELGVEPHTLRFTNRFVYNDSDRLSGGRDQLFKVIRSFVDNLGGGSDDVKVSPDEISVNSVQVKVDAGTSDAAKEVVVSWTHTDEALGSKILNLAQNYCMGTSQAS